MIPRLPKLYEKLIEIADAIFDWLNKAESYLLDRKWIEWTLRKRLFTIVPLIGLTFQLISVRTDKDFYMEQSAALRESNAFLRQSLESSNRIMDDWDSPAWYKLKRGDKFIMLDVNNAYEKSFLKGIGLTEFDYVGRTDFQIQSIEDALTYFSEDSLVAETGKVYYALGRYKERNIMVKKWRKIERNDTLVYGLAIEITEILKNIKKLCPCDWDQKS